jgi:ankyrin repeat protein
MNLLHFTCKFGATKIGHEKEAIQVINVLIDKGINLTSHCLWIQMNCLHYCAFFDSSSICELLLKQSKVLTCKQNYFLLFIWVIAYFSLVLNQPCSSLKNHTPLHLACASLSLPTAQALLQAGADKRILDDQQRTPAGEILSFIL